MSGEPNSAPKGRPGMSMPGQPTEEAVAEVGSEAGKSLVRGFANLADASLGGWITARRAKAEAARLAIETDARIASEQALIDARRRDELSEIDHQGLLRRRLDRMLNELEIEQRNLEAIQRKAIEFAERDPERDEAREIDQDWLFRAADLAQKISDEDVQEFWARAMSSAAIKSTQPLSAAALQTLGLLDKRAAQDFRKFVMISQRLGFFAAIDEGPPLRQIEPQGIDLISLVDLGLIRHQADTNAFRLADFTIAAGSTSNIGLALFQDRFLLTKRGVDIANAVFRGQKIDIDEELEQEYLQNLLQRELHHNKTVTIILPSSDRPEPCATVVLRPHQHPTSGPAPVMIGASPRLERLLGWASDFCSFELR